MPIVSTTLCYPNPAAPTQGLFIARRLAAIHRLMPLRVVAPMPWFPLVRARHASSLNNGNAPMGDPDAPPVVHPAMFYFPGAMKRWDAAFYARALRHALRASPEPAPIRLIDAHFVWPDGVGAWRVAQELGVPFVCTIRGKLVSQIRHPAKRRLIVDMLRGADGLVAVSQSLAKLARQVADADLPIRVIPNGIDRAIFHRTMRTRPTQPIQAARGLATVAAGSFRSDVDGDCLEPPPTDPDRTSPSAAARRSLGFVASARYVVSVGHLQELKGFHHLVEIWSEVRRRAGDVRLILVGGDAGEPAYARRLHAQVESINPPRHAGDREAPIRLLSRQSPNQVARLLNAADLFVLASRSEGWCNGIAEALACGCPVVATDVGGNREIVRDPRRGRLVPFGDPLEMIEAICAALDHRWDRAWIADLGGRRDWDKVARECVSLFQMILNERFGESDAETRSAEQAS